MEKRKVEKRTEDHRVMTAQLQELVATVSEISACACSTDWLIDWLIDCLIDWSIDWLICPLNQKPFLAGWNFSVQIRRPLLWTAFQTRTNPSNLRCGGKWLWTRRRRRKRIRRFRLRRSRGAMGLFQGEIIEARYKPPFIIDWWPNLMGNIGFYFYMSGAIKRERSTAAATAAWNYRVTCAISWWICGKSRRKLSLVSQDGSTIKRYDEMCRRILSAVESN